MYEINPNQAGREDSRFWYVDEKLRVTKPGDVVIVEMVLGEKFGRFDGIEKLGKAAIFLGEFKEDEEDSLEVARMFIDPAELDNLSSDEIAQFAGMPYFRAYFDSVGEVTFAGIECFWQTQQQLEAQDL